MRLGSVGFATDQGNSLLFGSLGIEENLLFKNWTNPILCFPLSLSLSYSDSLLSFASVVVKDSHSHTHTPTSIYPHPSLRSFFGDQETYLGWVAFTNLVPTPWEYSFLFLGLFLDWGGGGVVIFVHLLGCVVVTLRYLI